ncbi:mechanosensitive ion channel domain-containing protein [Anaerobiospirillum succiniciproducens]|uniref:mechanosensitive ion channel domain-containing protein n=1 Tax=Anaerobiospirillum succiniciproducens TaxID=13335 RepID=UPI00248DF0A8|nr:mechanosensitive ion channel domain-containing protein [Anaerobiospirillum succiniciproducens]
MQRSYLSAFQAVLYAMLFVCLSYTCIGSATAASLTDQLTGNNSKATSDTAPQAAENNTANASAQSKSVQTLNISHELNSLLRTDINADHTLSDPKAALKAASKTKSAAVNDMVPNRAVLLQRLEGIDSDPNLTQDEKNRSKAILKHAIDVIDIYDTVVREEILITTEVEKAKEMLSDLEQSLSNANNLYNRAPPKIKFRNAQEADKLIATLTERLNSVQEQLNESTSAYNSMQLLPSRAQNIITANNATIFEISKRLNDPTVKLLSDESGLLSFEIFVLEKQNSLLQSELRSLTTFQDIANYKIRIGNLQKDYLNNYLSNVRAKQNTLFNNEIVNRPELNENEVDISTPKLAAEFKYNSELANNIDKTLSDNARLKKDLQDVTSALNSARQIDKSLKEQLSDLSGSVILSRLLNRQLGELPKISISFKLDELIPNLNLYMYELRSYREQIFDIQIFVDDMIRRDPSYEPYREQLIQLIRQRRALSDELYNTMSDGLTIAIDLRAKYNELNTTVGTLTTSINDHLFWLASNQGISLDFITNFYPTFMLQFRNFLRYTTTELVTHEILINYIQVLIPLLLIGFIFKRATPFFVRLTNELALRLDKASDNYTVTPRALIYHFFLILPKVAFITLIGSIFIFFTVDDFDSQKNITFLLMLHLICFLYMRHIMEPNSLVQRHFSVSPRVIAQNRAIIDQLWFVSIPMLMIANMREAEPTKISGDVIGYPLMVFGFLYLTFFAIKTVKRSIERVKPDMTFWTISIISIITPLTITVMLGLGYYYTVIQLLNRVAITLYICFLYLILSNTLRRELYVAEVKMLSAIRSRMQQQHEAQANAANLTATATATPEMQGKQRLESFRLELVNGRAYKLFNACLLTVFIYFMYQQWNDLAGVLTYLDHIYLWESIKIVDGQTISSTLSLGDVLLAIVIVIVSVVLNHNLPLLIERLFMIRKGVEAKSTSYTIKLITSYTITTLGVIFAASALGISWDNLQWLVAALSVGLGFGLQEIFGNFVSGIIILFERQLRVGDIVTLSNLSGTVSRIRIRATTITSFDNKEVVIPNKQFITSAVTNWSLSNTVTKLEFAIGVAYGADTNKAKDILRGIIRRCRDLNRDKKPLVFIKSLDASAVTIMCEVFVNEIGKRKAVYDYLSTEALRLFRDHNIEIPFDQLDVTIRNLDTNTTVTYTEKDVMQAAAMGAAAKKKNALIPV